MPVSSVQILLIEPSFSFSRNSPTLGAPRDYTAPHPPDNLEISPRQSQLDYNLNSICKFDPLLWNLTYSQVLGIRM